MLPIYLFLGIWVLLVVLAISFGVYMLVNEKFMRRLIKLQNKAKGVKTEITSTTILFSKIGAIFLIVIGCIMLVGMLIVWFGVLLPQIQQYPERFVFR